MKTEQMVVALSSYIITITIKTKHEMVEITDTTNRGKTYEKWMKSEK